MTDCGVGGLEAIDKLVQYTNPRLYFVFTRQKIRFSFRDDTVRL